MAGVLDSVDQRTQLVGANRLELLLFRLNGPQIYGINVFKVKEVLQCPKLTILPKSHRVVIGVAHIRTGTIPIMDLGLATGSVSVGEPKACFVIITEYNMATQGFLVSGVERIVNMNWEEIHPPPKGTGREHYLTAVTEIDDRLVEIIDVEKILSEVSPSEETISEDVLSNALENAPDEAPKVLIVDDSKIARKQVTKCLQALGVDVTALCDGRQALTHLQDMVTSGVNPANYYDMMISDIEMPEMDGYTLTTEVRGDPNMTGMHIILHTSLSGVFNQNMVQKVGADDFIAKFNPDILAEKVSERTLAVRNNV
ncbi:MAG: two-component system chemotaxis response regulator CheV [Crocinitomicaceae bacterium]|jgi:two-component system chemotaxis response regulator CheV